MSAFRSGAPHLRSTPPSPSTRSPPALAPAPAQRRPSYTASIPAAVAPAGTAAAADHPTPRRTSYAVSSTAPAAHNTTRHAAPAQWRPALVLGTMLAAAAALVAAAPTPAALVPEPREGVSYRAWEGMKGDVADASAAFDLELERVRAAARHIVDPTAPWIAAALETTPAGGWISHWLGGGEGLISVIVDDDASHNLSLPHRPAAFPDWLGPSAQLPINGTLVPFAEMPPPPRSGREQDHGGAGGGDAESEAANAASDSAATRAERERACVPPAWPPIRPSFPRRPYTIALVERGGCDFATKVLAAQERGAAAVVVGDSVARKGETDEEGRARENLITMFSPDTTGIIIPSVFVSRASYLTLRDLLANHTVDGKPGLFVVIGEASDDGSALGSLLTFALLMPSLFLIATVAAHRVRVARQREANRAPPTVVLSLPERVWTPDIVWEKDDSESDKDSITGPRDAPETEAPRVDPGKDAPESTTEQQDAPTAPAAGGTEVLEASAVTTTSAVGDDEGDAVVVPVAKPARRRGKERRRSKRYYSKDECAICMDNFHKGEIVRILPCGHVFHKDECDEWLLKWRKLCPTCRADVTIPATDLSASATLTPVVDRTAASPDSPTGYGAVDDARPLTVRGDTQDDEDNDASWLSSLRQRAAGRLSAAWGSLRSAVARPRPQQGEQAPLVTDSV